MGVQSWQEGPPKVWEESGALIRMWREQGSGPSPGGGWRDTLGGVCPEGPLTQGKGMPAHHTLLGPPYVDSAQVKPLLQTQLAQSCGTLAYGGVGWRGGLGAEGFWVRRPAGWEHLHQVRRTLSKVVHNTALPHLQAGP